MRGVPIADSSRQAGPGPRVVIGHDFAETFGGAERVLAAIAEVFPEAPVYAIAGRAEVAERIGIGDRFHPLLPESPLLLRHYRPMAPLFPALISSRRLPEADLLLTSSYAFAHRMRTRNGAPQVCFCHSPLRFAWTMTEQYAARTPGGAVGRAALRAVAAGMRRGDRRASRRVDLYLAGCRNVAGQIEAAYDAIPRLIRPPVDTERFRPGDSAPGGYYLIAARLVEPYKQVGTAIQAFEGLDAELRIAGSGPAEEELRALAGPNVTFLGELEDDELIPQMQGCAAGLFPSRDDLGLAPIEIMACGRPVLAYGAGGALETVVAGETGEFFERQDPAALAEALRAFEPASYDAARIRSHAEGWSPSRFEAELREIVAGVAGGGVAS